jgi:hypothetical protein
MATSYNSAVLPSSPLVPRYALRGPYGYLADTVKGNALDFCARPVEAKVYYLRKTAELKAQKLGLEVVSLPYESTDDSNIFVTETPVSALELLIRFCIESAGVATFVGIQKAFEAKGIKHSAVVLWNSKKSGSTLGCKIEVLSTQKVKEITAESDAKFSQFADADLAEVAWG